MAAAAPQQLPFALVPADVVIGPLDYTSRQGLSVYSRNTKPLFSDETRFDCDAAGLQALLDLLADRETPSSWDFDIPVDLVGGMQGPGVINGPFKYLIRQHGEITLAHP
jgi:hypothetical protein